jgi:putative ABC transport system ATP-binding protein
MSSIVELDGVSKSFSSAGGSTPVLRDVGLTITAGEKASLVGPSGSGKSTLLSLIAGLLRPDSGSIAIDGIALAGLGDRQRAQLRADRVGIALQSDNLIPFLSARENVELALAFASTSRSARATRARATDLLAGLGLADRADHKPRHLSGGEAQRVALAVAMANEPALLLADEVVAALDSETAARVVDQVLSAEFAVLYVSHDVALADLVTSRYQLVDQQVVPR